VPTPDEDRGARIILIARHFLQDAVEPYRQSDAELLKYLKDGIGEIAHYRPDALPAGQYGPCSNSETGFDSLDPAVLDLMSAFWRRLLSYYVAGSAQLKDDEFVGPAVLMDRFERAVNPRYYSNRKLAPSV
jgi:hypothetical protein